MRGVRALAVGLSLLLPGVSSGADVRLALAGSTEYDDNVFRSESNKKDDVVFRVTPQVNIVEDREKLNYSVGYMLPYEVGVQYTDAINDFNHLVNANFRYRATPQTEIFGSDSFYYVEGLFRQQQDATDPEVGDLGDDRARVLDNYVELGVGHYFTPRLSGSLTVNQGIYDTDQQARSNTLSFGAVASGAYQLTERHQLGSGFSYSRQMFDDTFNRAGSDTDYYNLFGSWKWTFDETTTFEIQAGPALIHSSQDDPSATLEDQPPIPYQENGRQLGFPNDDDAIIVSLFQNCPVVDGDTLLFDPAGRTCALQQLVRPINNATIDAITGAAPITLTYPVGAEPQGVTDTRVTYFANATLTKRWTPTLASSLSYVRREDTASGIDGGAVLDAVMLTSTWRISERWDASVRSDWTLRQSATEGARQYVIVTPQAVPGLVGNVAAFVPDGLTQIDSSDSLDTQRWGVATRLAYRLTKNTVTALQYSYNKQSSDGDTVGQSSDFDNHLVTFTVQYNFEPIGLPW
jgi:hypothetical protein